MSHAAVARIIDANLNRCREALRVAEEYARFALDDARLSGECKSLRHRLAAAAALPEITTVITHRAIETDVGTTLSTPAEFERADAGAVAVAALKRATESLRALEEYGKTLSATFAREMESLRYGVYSVEHRVMLAARPNARFAEVRIYVIITESACRGSWLDAARQALQGGADCLQLREKTLDDRALLARARALTELCRAHDALCIVNDRPDIAALAGASGVHLGQDDLTTADARRILPPGSVIGRSTHSLSQAVAAAADRPDYIAVGPMYPSSTKPRDFVAGTDVLAEVRSAVSIPLVAIGGITSAEAAHVVSSGASCLCVCRAVLEAEDVAEAVRALRRSGFG